MPTKQTPKSCSCNQCKFGKGTKAGHKEMRADEKKVRNKSRMLLKKATIDNDLDVDVPIVPIGNYYD